MILISPVPWPTTFVGAAPIGRQSPSSHSRSALSRRNENDNSSSQHQKGKPQPDRFVSASPLVVGAVCNDGVALLCLHTASESEPLLFELDDDDGEETLKDDGGMEDEKVDQATKFPLDLPSSHRGPFRIEPIDDRGTAIAAAGWRTDCASLANRCRSIASSEAELYGSGEGIGIGGSGRSVEEREERNEDWGRVLAERASHWMAQCAYSQGVRNLSCAALIATCHYHCTTPNSSEDRAKDGRSGQLYLVDGTGAQRVRALAIGLNSDRVNKQLVRVNFLVLNKEEGAQKLLKIVTEEGYGSNTHSKEGLMEGDEIKKETAVVVPKGIRVEMAVVDSVRAKFQRVRQRSIITPPGTVNTAQNLQ